VVSGAQGAEDARRAHLADTLAALEAARHPAAAEGPHTANAWWQIDSSDALRQLLQRRAPGQPLATPSRAKLGEILLERGLVQQEQIDRALQMQCAAASTARPLLGQLLIRLGAVAEEDTIRASCCGKACRRRSRPPRSPCRRRGKSVELAASTGPCR
jgi:hypothetical protein